MKITSVVATPVRVPRPQAFSSSLGVSLDTENAVVEIQTDEGITGLGEISFEGSTVVFDAGIIGESPDGPG